MDLLENSFWAGPPWPSKWLLAFPSIAAATRASSLKTSGRLTIAPGNPTEGLVFCRGRFTVKLIKLKHQGPDPVGVQEVT